VGQVLDLAIGDLGTCTTERRIGFLGHADWKHPVQNTVHQIDWQALQANWIDHLEQHRMKGR
jgi:hypothetical protein